MQNKLSRAVLIVLANIPSFTFAPVAVTLACFEAFGLIYGPFIPLTYALFQSATTTANLPTVLAGRLATPLGTAIGGPLGAAETLTVSGAATVLLAAAVSGLLALGSTLTLLVERVNPEA